MNRLTYAWDDGTWCLKDLGWGRLEAGKKIDEYTAQRIYDALYRLKKYEDGGFSPDDLEALREGEDGWIPVSTGHFPEHGKYVLLSFSNFPLPEVGRYEEDGEGGGAFYAGDDDTPLTKVGIFVNAWRPIPKSYRGE